ncbi:hypothetical protein [Leifsonia sp. Leaf264]|uniref:hypothetical protein n=1 Tax=Leifsonia sp. Leaf264 TaxID=1736314 RepID=UPI0006F7F7AB|nr:hypothetical protein [Leifsonia sp. Leaf264]KQO98536.1 hypothetical protein ASF30_10770 [Leifsonia sp. Leaf264]
MTELDVLDDQQVASPSKIEADLGVGGRSLIIASGIAIPSWGIDDPKQHREQCVVHLRIPADRIEHVTTHVGLASIGNDDTGFGIAVDKADVSINPTTGELDLTTELSLAGDSVMWRFSYQVVATVVRTVNEITGTIGWPKDRLDPGSTSPSAVAPHFLIQLNDRVMTKIEGEPGTFGGETETLTPIGVGEITAVKYGSKNIQATYRINNPPKGRELRVTVTPIGFPIGAGETVGAGAVPAGTDVFTLTIDQPSRSNVDFKVAFSRVR